MKDKRFWFGTVATVGWLVFMAFMLATTTHPTTLNEWGDFFAGAFAPIAFLWLVLGYLQQGDELRNSADALHLQAEELKNSVLQQTQLVEVSRLQLDQERETFRREQERRREAAQPVFLLSPSSVSTTTQGVVHQVIAQNAGNSAFNLRLTMNPPIGASHNTSYQHVDRSGTISFQFESRIGRAVATLDYLDSGGAPGQIQFTLAIGGDGQLAIGPISRTL
jgi:hypothetical protein